MQQPPFSSSQATAAKDPVSGDWTGKLIVGAVALRVVFHLKQSRSGGWTGTMDSPDQGARGIPIPSVTFDGKRLVIDFPNIQARFDGVAQPDRRIVGTWTQGGRQLPLALIRSATPNAAPKRPQEPRGPFPYRTEEVVFDSVARGVRLSATLVVPRGKGPFPAVVLVSGSGPQDRDESLMGHKPFAVVADHLARAGFATLRADDRGVGKSTGDFVAANSADFADDAEGAVRFLQSRPDIRKERIGIAGHSEGGIIAPMVAARNPEVGFLILLAGTGVPGIEVIAAQSDAIQRAVSVPTDVRRRNGQLQRALLDLARDLRATAGNGQPAPALVQSRLAAVLDPFVASLSESERAAFTSERSPLEAQFREMLSPWFTFFLEHDPRPVLRQVRVPVLVLNGARDLQVLPGQNVAEIVGALRSGGNRRVVSRILPGLNHLFQTCRTGAPTEYGEIEETFAPKALREMVAFLRALG